MHRVLIKLCNVAVTGLITDYHHGAYVFKINIKNLLTTNSLYNTIYVQLSTVQLVFLK